MLQKILHQGGGVEGGHAQRVPCFVRDAAAGNVELEVQNTAVRPGGGFDSVWGVLGGTGGEELRDGDLDEGVEEATSNWRCKTRRSDQEAVSTLCVG